MYPKRLFNLHKDFPFLPERKKVRKVKNVKKLVCGIEDKKIYICFSHKSLKTSIKSRINIKNSTQSNSI